MKFYAASLLAGLALTFSGCSRNAQEAPSLVQQKAESGPPSQPSVKEEVKPVLTTADSTPTTAQPPTLEAPKDETWYLIGANVNACIKLSDAFKDVQTPEQMIVYALNEANTRYVQQKTTDDIVVLQDPTGATSALGLARGKRTCEIALKLVQN